MRTKSTFILLAVTLGVIAFIALYERELTSSTDAIANESKVINLDSEQVTRIEISNDFGVAELQKEKDGTWLFRGPFSDRADQAKINSILDNASKLTIYETLSEKELQKEKIKPEELGFGDKKITLRFFKADEKIASIEIGDKTELKDVSYIRTAGNWEKTPVHAAWDKVRDTVGIPFNDLRDKHLLVGEAEKIREIKFVHDQSSILVEWIPDDGRWKMQKPLATRASKFAMEDKLRLLFATEITDFLDPNSIVDAFSEGSTKIRVWFTWKRGPTDIELSEPKSDDQDFIYATVNDRKGSIFKLPKHLANAFNVNPNDLRDRDLTAIDEAAISEIKIEQLNRDGSVPLPIQLYKSKGKWFVTRSGHNEDANGAKVTELIESLNKEQVIEFASDSATDLAPYGLDEPTLSLTFTIHYVVVPEEGQPVDANATPKTGTKTQILQLGASADNTKTYAKVADEPFIYRLGPHLISSLYNGNSIQWKSKILLRFNRMALRSFTIERHPRPPVRLAYDLSFNSWTGSSSGNDITETIDPKRADEVAALLTNFEVNQWTADRATASRLLQDERILTISFDSENRNEGKIDTTRLIFAPTEAGIKGPDFYGKIDDPTHPDIFRIKRSDLLTLIRPLTKPVKEEPAKAPQP
jgi:hypothetical protein